MDKLDCATIQMTSEFTFPANITQKSFREVDVLVTHADVVIEAVLAGEKFIAVRTVQSNQFLLEDFIAIHL